MFWPATWALGSQLPGDRSAQMGRLNAITSAGQILGTVIAVFAVRLLEGLLFGVATTDLAVFSVTSLSLAAVALLTTYLPSRSVSRIDPSLMLQQE